MRTNCFSVLCTAALLMGCAQSAAPVNQDQPAPSAAAQAGQTPAGETRQPPSAGPTEAAGEAQPSAQPAAETEAGSSSRSEGQPAEKVQRVEAKAGVGARGQHLEKPEVNRAIAAPVRSLFAFEQKAELEFKMKHALDLYKATHGKLPESHQQFMNEIIKANYIQLPRLPPGQRYVWDPKDGKLYVEKPAR